MTMRQHILLTGATGALGPALAAALLSSGTAERIDVLVRNGKTCSRERFDSWRREVASCMPHFNTDVSRLHMIEGDVALEHLGIVQSDAEELTRRVKVVIHAAADTRFLSPPGQQWNTNVEGTRRVLELAERCPRLRQFIYISTTCVAGTSVGPVLETFVTPPGFTNYYERTKWEAEQLVMASHLPVRIARISVVMGSGITGVVHRLGALHQVLRWYGSGLIPLVPGTSETRVDLMDVESVSHFLAKAVAQESANGSIWHIAAGEHSIPLAELMAFVWSQFNDLRFAESASTPKIVDAATYHATSQSTTPIDRARLRLQQSIDCFLPGLLLYPRIFDTSQAQTLWGGPLPMRDWRETLRRVIHFLRRQRAAPEVAPLANHPERSRA